MKRLLLFVFTFIGSAALGIYLFTPPGCACADIFPERIYRFSALNPIRDRAPELVAQKFLREQGQGKCLSTDSGLCRNALNSRPVLDWRLAAREDVWNGVVLYYYVKARESDRGHSDEFWGQAAVWIDRQANVWKITGYSAAY